MAPGPTIKPLSRARRRAHFIVLVSVFIIIVPIIVLYASGYRMQQEGINGRTLIGTGGVYVAVDRSESEIFIDEDPVNETRTFRRGFYAQDLEPGLHRVHVQKDGHYTWVKEIVVESHRVTEAQAFNLPIDPVIREIPRLRLSNGELIFELSTSTATATKELLASRAVRTETNTEYVAVSEFFAVSSATSTDTLLKRVTQGIGDIFATTTELSLSEQATTSKEWRGIKLYERGDDIYASWVGKEEDVPYYFCATTSTTTDLEVELSLEASAAESLVEGKSACRSEVRIDRKSQTVHSFDFFPDNVDLVLLVLDDGIYVVEIDDRGWQNVQPLYLKEGLVMRLDDGNIYVKDGVYIFEVIVEI